MRLKVSRGPVEMEPIAFCRKCAACSKSHNQRKQNKPALTRRHLAPLSHLQILHSLPALSLPFFSSFPLP
jgi:hypothetical protein